MARNKVNPKQGKPRKKKAGKKKASKKKAAHVVVVKPTSTVNGNRGRRGNEGHANGSRPPADLTWDLVKELCATVSAGNFRYVAMQKAGIHSERFKRWMSQGHRDLKLFATGELKGDLNMYCHLVVELEAAEGASHSEMIRDVLGSEDPRLVFEFMKLRYNKLYNKNPNSRIDDADGTEIKIDARTLLIERLAHFMDNDE